MAIPELIDAKEKLDSLIRKQRVALYKPIQIAEILYQVRVGELSVDDIRQNLEFLHHRIDIRTICLMQTLCFQRLLLFYLNTI